MATAFKRILLLATFLCALILLLPWIIPLYLSANMFKPEPLSSEQSAPAYWGLALAQSHNFKTSDATELHGWWLPATHQPACYSVIIFHGRSANISTRTDTLAWLAAEGFNSFIFDYRGYGASENKRIDEQSLNIDSLAAYDFVTSSLLRSSDNIVLLGQSLGSAMASYVNKERTAAGLILVSPARSSSHLLHQHLPSWFPSTWPSWNGFQFNTSEHLRQAPNTQLIIAVGEQDTLVPPKESRALYDQMQHAMHWVPVSNHGHSGLLQSQALHQLLGPVLTQQFSCSPPTNTFKNSLL